MSLMDDDLFYPGDSLDDYDDGSEARCCYGPGCCGAGSYCCKNNPVPHDHPCLHCDHLLERHEGLSFTVGLGYCTGCIPCNMEAGNHLREEPETR